MNFIFRCFYFSLHILEAIIKFNVLKLVDYGLQKIVPRYVSILSVVQPKDVIDREEKFIYCFTIVEIIYFLFGHCLRFRRHLLEIIKIDSLNNTFNNELSQKLHVFPLKLTDCFIQVEHGFSLDIIFIVIPIVLESKVFEEIFKLLNLLLNLRLEIVNQFLQFNIFALIF